MQQSNEIGRTAHPALNCFQHITKYEIMRMIGYPYWYKYAGMDAWTGINSALLDFLILQP
jgi:hypothetical protein